MAGPTQADEDEPITAINIIPLVDIVLVLLIIFMMTASYIVAPAIKVELPKAATGEPTPQSMLSLVITREGDLFVNNARSSFDDLRSFLRDEMAAGRIPEAVIAADASVSHGRVVSLIDLIKQEGVVTFALNTDDDFSSAEVPEPETPPNP